MTVTWSQNAACLGQPSAWFYPEPAEQPDPRALALCDACTVRAVCEDAGSDEFGVWGGTLRNGKMHEDRFELSDAGRERLERLVATYKRSA